MNAVLHTFRAAPLFSLTVVVLTLSAVGGTYFAWDTARQTSELKTQLQHQRQRFQSLTQTTPAPTLANLDAAHHNIVDLKTQLNAARDALFLKRNLLDSPKVALFDEAKQTPHQLLFQIQESIDTLRVAAASHTPPVQIPDDFHFGFDAYNRSGTPPDPKNLRLISQQHLIVTALVKTLYAAGTHSLLSVKLNGVSLHSSIPKNHTGAKPERDFAAPSKKKPRDRIDNLNFEFTFNGYTHTLRHFLNEIALQEPSPHKILLNVHRVTIIPTTPSTQGTTADVDPLNALVDALSEEDNKTPSFIAKEPVISENLSQFTVIIEGTDLSGKNEKI